MDEPFEVKSTWAPIWATGELKTEFRGSELGSAGYTMMAQRIEEYKYLEDRHLRPWPIRREAPWLRPGAGRRFRFGIRRRKQSAPIQSVRFRVQGTITDYLTTLHHEDDVANGGYVFKRITGKRNDVSVFSGIDAAQVVRFAQHLS